MTLFVFLVEDDPAIRASLVLAMSGILDAKFVGFAKGEPEAIEWLASNQGKWNLAVVELFIEEGSGFGIMTEMQHLPKNEHVVMLTNSATSENRQQALQCGAHAVFDKTEELDQFFAYCENLKVSEH